MNHNGLLRLELGYNSKNKTKQKTLELRLASSSTVQTKLPFSKVRLQIIWRNLNILVKKLMLLMHVSGGKSFPQCWVH